MTITADDYRALARSSPWLWRSVRFRWDGGPVVTMARPARGVVEDADGTTREEQDPGKGMTRFRKGADGYVPYDAPTPAFVSEAQPRRRADGLVAERPDAGDTTQPDQPMVAGYFSVAAVDPVELADDVDLTDVPVETLRGRETWVATCRAGEEYSPRCGCCPLIMDRRGALLEWGPQEGATIDCHESVEIWLDRATGIMTRWVPTPEPGSPAEEPIDVEIEWVDGDVDAVWDAAG